MEEFVKVLASYKFAALPLYFWLVCAIVLLLVFLPQTRKRNRLTIDLKYWRQRVPFKSKRFLVLLFPVIIISILMCAAMTNPKINVRSITSVKFGKPVMIVMDVSGSMEAAPIPKTRPLIDKRSKYEKAIAIFNDLTTYAQADFGLLLYSTESYIARYFAYKNELLKDTIENKEEVLYISTGTRTDEALAKARQLLSDIKGKDKTIVLVSDFEADMEGITRLSEEISRDLWADIKIYVITLGEQDQGASGSLQMAGVTKVDIHDQDSMNQIFKEISEMQSSPIIENEVLKQKSLIPFLIFPALGLIILCLVLGETRFRKIP